MFRYMYSNRNSREGESTLWCGKSPPSRYMCVNLCFIACTSPYRFSQFFISPLFTADATDREINAVDSGTS